MAIARSSLLQASLVSMCFGAVFGGHEAEASADPDNPYASAIRWGWSGTDISEAVGNGTSGHVASSALSTILWTNGEQGLAAVPAAARVYAIRRIVFGEGNGPGADMPFYLATSSAHLPGADTHPSLEGTVNAFFTDASKSNAARSDKFVGVSAARGVAAIKAIQVCQNDPQNKDERELKGLRIWGGPLDANGQVTGVDEGVTREGMRAHPETALGNPIEAKRANCKHWGLPAVCEANQAAGGLRVHWTPKGVQALSLICRKMDRADSMPSPVTVRPLSGTYNGVLTVRAELTLTPSYRSAHGTAVMTTPNVQNLGANATFSLQAGGKIVATFTTPHTSWESLGCSSTMTLCDYGHRWSFLLKGPPEELNTSFGPYQRVRIEKLATP